MELNYYVREVLPGSLRVLAENTEIGQGAIGNNILTHSAEAMEWMAEEIDRLKKELSE